MILAGILSCNGNIVEPDDIDPDPPRELNESEKTIAESDGAFSYTIFRETVKYDDGTENVFISPLSISMALAMVLNGAEGETRAQMKETLGLSGLDESEINQSFLSLMNYLMTIDPGVSVKIANSVWFDENLGVKQEFLDRLRESFEARGEALNFSDPASVDVINAWVNENTEGRIETIIDEISDEMVMFLINALYFKGEWQRQFDANDTREADFYLENGNKATVDMMYQSGDFATYFSEEVQMIELPYGDSLYSMSVLMPTDFDQPIDEFVDKSVTKENLDNWRSGLRSTGRDVMIRLPKFELEYELSYKEILQSMGMKIPFEESEADFSGIAELSGQNLFISEVKHKTFVLVDEEGTEAAAATSVGVGVTSAPPAVEVNRPFVFIIHERTSGVNLFMGKVKNPAIE
jgi:serpin B